MSPPRFSALSSGFTLYPASINDASSLRRAQTGSDLHGRQNSAELEASHSSASQYNNFFESICPLMQKYYACVSCLNEGMSQEKIEATLEFIERELPLWSSRKERVYLKRKQNPELAFTIEYDPATSQVYVHRKGTNAVVLGQGSFAVVTESLVLQTGQKLANKTYLKVPDAHLEPHEKIEMLKEGQKHRALEQCQHVVKVHRVSEKGLLLEHMPLNSLMQLLSDGYELGPQERAFIAEQVIAAMCEMHDSGYVHKDIKLDNVLLNAPTTAKLGDLGTTSRIGQMMRANRGSPLSWSPQIWESWVKNEEHESRPEDDMWAMGMLLYELEHGLDSLPPFVEILGELAEACKARHSERAEMLNQEFRQQVKAFEGQWQVSKGSLDSLIKEMLRLDPLMRCSDLAARSFRLSR